IRKLPGGGKKNNKSYDQCAKRETKEETDVEIYELDLVTIHQGFRVFSDDKECNQIPKQVEASNNDEWFSVELKNLGKYDLMDSLKEFKSVIVEKINNNHSIALSEDEIEISKVHSEEEIFNEISKL
ncbi:7748_t:CDS:2, partial [Gigaspora rosea]